MASISNNRIPRIGSADMETRYTEADFEMLSWHDCNIWRFELRAGDPDRQEWVSELVLNFDYLAEWICGVGGAAAQFRVVPAVLVFYGVTDLKIGIDWGDSGHRCALHELSIDRIDREPVPDQKVYLDRAYYRWSIRLNWPQGGEITFGAAGFTQTMKGEGVLTDRQRLSLEERQHR